MSLIGGTDEGDLKHNDPVPLHSMPRMARQIEEFDLFARGTTTTELNDPSGTQPHSRACKALPKRSLYHRRGTFEPT
ncbi:hypothetical protein GCM10027418_04840 [Mariniluteicoccus endophyticus]